MTYCVHKYSIYHSRQFVSCNKHTTILINFQRYSCCLWHWNMHTYIGVIYWGYRYPTFLDWGYRTPTFQNTGKEFAVIRGDLRRLNYTKTVFDRHGPRRRIHISSWCPCTTFSPPELVPPLFRPKLRPCVRKRTFQQQQIQVNLKAFL